MYDTFLWTAACKLFHLIQLFYSGSKLKSKSCRKYFSWKLMQVLLISFHVQNFEIVSTFLNTDLRSYTIFCFILNVYRMGLQFETSFSTTSTTVCRLHTNYRGINTFFLISRYSISKLTVLYFMFHYVTTTCLHIPRLVLDKH